MQWTAQQDDALKRVAKWLVDPQGRQFLYLAGYAGTGKTTLAKHLAEGISGTVLYAAYTGKAAHVLRSKGCDNATTIHSLIYLPRGQCAQRLRELEEKLANVLADPKATTAQRIILETAIEEERKKITRPAFSLNENSPVREANLVIIDECSMISDKLGSDLLSFNTPVLVLGDPAQLPPVKGAGFFTEREPDVLLTDVQRQARDNPIIDMATRVRSGESLPLGSYGDSKVVSRIDADEALASDQVIVGRNVTRQGYNKRLRQLKNYRDLLQEGEKVICLRNDHQAGLLNGSIWQVQAAVPEEDDALIGLSIKNEDGEVDCVAHRDTFAENVAPGGWFERQHAQEFTYGYAITCHKAQGSQFDDLLIVDESHVFRQDSVKWAYTALTRAAKRVTVLRP